MHLVCLSFHHIKTKYADFQRLRFKDPRKFYELSGRVSKERALIQTGTRIEVYALVTDKGQGVDSLLSLLVSKSALGEEDVKDFFKVYFDEEAVMHLFRMMGGIESRVLGETYIPEKVEQEFLLARGYSAVGPSLESLFEAAIRVGRRARAETKIEGRIPVANLAVKCIIKKMPSLKGKIVILLGAGLTGKKVAAYLLEKNAKVIVVNRNYDIGEMVAGGIGGAAVKYRQLNERLLNADVLVCATLASHYRVTLDIIRDRIGDRSKPLLIVDVSPLKNVDPAVSELPNVTLIDGNIRKAIEENMKTAKAETPKVAGIIKEEIESLKEGGFTGFSL